MGLATIDSHSHKVQTKLYKIPKFDVNRPNAIASKIQPFENVKIYNETYGHPDAVPTQLPDALHFFVNFDVF